MFNYLIKDYTLDTLIENFNNFHKCIKDGINQNDIEFYYNSFSNTLEQLEAASKDDQLNLQFLITSNILTSIINDIKQNNLLSYSTKINSDVIVTMQHLLHFIKKMDNFLKSTKKSKVYNFNIDDLFYLISVLEEFYTDFDFTPNELEQYQILDFAIFFNVYGDIYKELDSNQQTDLNTKSFKLYKFVLVVYNRHIANMVKNITTHNFYKLSIMIETFIFHILKKDISNIDSKLMIKNNQLDPLPEENNNTNSLLKENTHTIIVDIPAIKDSPIDKVNDTEPTIQEQVEMQEIAELKTKFLFLHELGIIKHIETEYLKHNTHTTDKAIADIIATILQIDQAKQKESLRTYVRDLKKDTFYTTSQKEKVKKLMINLNLIK